MNLSAALGRLKNIAHRRAVCWEMAGVFLENQDAHGIHDMGVEIQALDRAALEIKAIFNIS